MRQGPRISVHLAGLALVIGFAAAMATPGRAEIYKDLRVTLNSMLAGIVGAPERAPRDLVINGQPLEFTPIRAIAAFPISPTNGCGCWPSIPALPCRKATTGKS